MDIVAMETRTFLRNCLQTDKLIACDTAYCKKCYTKK